MRLKVNKNLFQVNPRERIALLWSTVIISIITLAVVLDNRANRDIVITCLDDQVVVVGSSANKTVSVARAASDKYWASFGDLFSSDAHLDTTRTDMFLDDRVTALIFPPVYEIKNQESCLDNFCGLEVDDLQATYRLGEKNFQDLSAFPRPFPEGVRESEIVFADINDLGNRQVALFVVQEGAEERGLAYFINGNKYETIIAFDINKQIKTKYGRGGGRMAIGGADNEFLIVYTGYEGKAFHYYQGSLEDVSHFFGLRVADGGFHPYIIKQGQGSQSTWYVVSRSVEKNKLIKLWQNDSPQIVGAYDLSDELEEKLGGGKITAISSGDKGEINFVVSGGSGTPDDYSLWTFRDSGFDNSRSRVALSKNIDNRNLSVSQANIKDLNVSSYQRLSIYLSNSADRFVPVNPGQAIKFSEAGNELFWKMEFTAGPDKEYSPWFDGIGDLQYLVAP